MRKVRKASAAAMELRSEAINAGETPFIHPTVERFLAGKQHAAPQYLYRPMYRPAHGSAFPKDVTWDYVEAPRLEPMIAVRRGLPLSHHNHGVISTNRPLTADERKEFEMELA